MAELVIHGIALALMLIGVVMLGWFAYEIRQDRQRAAQNKSLFAKMRARSERHAKAFGAEWMDRYAGELIAPVVKSFDGTQPADDASFLRSLGIASEADPAQRDVTCRIPVPKGTVIDRAFLDRLSRIAPEEP